MVRIFDVFHVSVLFFRLYDDVNKKGSVIVAGQTELSVASKGEVYKILESGAEKRRTASTLMNAQSR